MKTELTNDQVSMIHGILQKAWVGAGGDPNVDLDFHISQPYVCDACKEVLAQPVDAVDRHGRKWGDLCPTCFDELGCEFEEIRDLSNAEIFEIVEQSQ